MLKGSRNHSSLGQNIVRVLIANFWVAIIGLLGSFVFPKILTVEDYALYHTFTLYVGYIAILHLGFPSGMVINYAGSDHSLIDKKQYKSELILLLSILSFFTALFLFVAVFSENRMVLYVASVIIPVCFNGSFYSLFQAWSRFKKYSHMSMFVSSAIPVCAFTYYLIFKQLPGDVYIIIYILVYWFVCIYILAQEMCFVKGNSSNKIFSRVNFETEKIGLSLVVGNYMNTLFGSADKQFVKWFFGAHEFAFYSFSMAMQTLMTVFITSVSQPLFPAMAQGKFSDADYAKVKRILFVFGSFSCCAYFAISIVIKLFIHKYIGSLAIVRLYFIVFPAMAVVNCIYINLYKIKNLMKLYIKTLIGILSCAFALNSASVYVFKHYSGIALATAVTYYIWLFVGSRQFKFINLNIKDTLYLIFFVAGFFAVTKMNNDYIGLVCSLFFVLFISCLFFWNEMNEFIFSRLRKFFGRSQQ